jgi:steroid 5-alpha reductase family enzyme
VIVKALLDPALIGIMKEIKNHTLVWSKGALFLTLGVASATLLLVEVATIRITLLLALTVWGFCRAYYFAFYVIEHHVDPRYRFSGLLSFVGYVIRRQPPTGTKNPP